MDRNSLLQPRCRARRRVLAWCSCSLAVAVWAVGESCAAWMPLAASGRLRLPSLTRPRVRRLPPSVPATVVAATATRPDVASSEVREQVPAYEQLAKGSLCLEDFELDRDKVPANSLFYVPDFITPEQEESLKREVDEAGRGARWTKCLNRRMQSFGAPGPLPPFLDQLAEAMHSCGAVSSQYYPNHCLVNDYMHGNGIGAHSDPDYFGPHVAIFSLLESTAMYFARTQPHSIIQPWHRLILAPRSMLVFRGEMYSNWTHEIPEIRRDTVEDVDWEGAGAPEPRLMRRLSLTLRRWM